MKVNQDEQCTERYNPEINEVPTESISNEPIYNGHRRLLVCIVVLVLIGLFSHTLFRLIHVESSTNMVNLQTQVPIESVSKAQTSELQKFSQQITETQPPIIQKSKQLNLRPIYIWLGNLPDRHKKTLHGAKYQFRLIRDCDQLLAKMQDELLQTFLPQIYSTINLKTDICKSIALYYYGGLYLDLDTTVDLPCYNNYLKDKRIFFEATEINTVSMFAIYSSKPYDPELLKAIRSYNTYRSYNRYYSAFTGRIDEKAKTIAKSGCITHKKQGSWRKTTKT